MLSTEDDGIKQGTINIKKQESEGLSAYESLDEIPMEF
jgi:hypothetical protein